MAAVAGSVALIPSYVEQDKLVDINFGKDYKQPVDILYEIVNQIKEDDYTCMIDDGEGKKVAKVLREYKKQFNL